MGSKEGQTREHARLSLTLGVKQMVVGINKMDHNSVNYAKERYEEIVAEAKTFLKSTGYKIDEIAFIPFSGWTGENLKLRENENDNKQYLGWYKGPTLIEALDKIKPPERPVSKPLRLPINDVFKISGIGTVPVGRVETGIIKSGMILRFTQSGFT